MIIEWPSRRLAPRIINLRLVNQTRSAGESLTGFEQVAASLSTRWAFSLDFANLKRQYIPAFRAMVAALRGRENVLRVPVFDPQFWPSDASLGIVAVTHSDGSAFSDGSLYYAEDVGGITVGGSKGSTSILVDFGGYGQVFGGGLYFGIENELYLAINVTWIGNLATIQFEPSLRQDHIASRFRLRPWLIMRKAQDSGGELALERGIIAAPGLELVEVLPDELAALEGGA
jgi:hypothetical protein